MADGAQKKVDVKALADQKFCITGIFTVSGSRDLFPSFPKVLITTQTGGMFNMVATEGQGSIAQEANQAGMIREDSGLRLPEDSETE